MIDDSTTKASPPAPGSTSAASTSTAPVGEAGDQNGLTGSPLI
jgi:hypothetical protein